MSEQTYQRGNRQRRRTVCAEERVARTSGHWEPWHKTPFSEDSLLRHGASADGWFKEVHTVYTNGWLVVMVRTCKTELGPVDHAIIRTARNSELRWREKQRVKNELFGKDRVAVEVFPKAAHVVDAADIYHLWVLPVGMVLPFGIHRDNEQEGQ